MADSGDLTSIQLTKKKRDQLGKMKTGGEDYEDVIDNLLKIYKFFIRLSQKLKIGLGFNETVESLLEKVESKMKEVLGE